MVNGCADLAWRQVAKVFRDGTLTGLSDREVLERFVDSRDESAFEVLLARHGPMVLNVCRQLLREPHDVEDAFQAAFLVLVRKAGSIRVEDSLGPWLYAVASRTAARARANRRRRNERESSRGDPPETANEDDLAALEIPQVVQEELSRLPERLRTPLVLCYLQGLTHDLAARQLGCPVGTVRSRLARARALLQKRIVRRGLSLSAAAIATALESNAKAAVVPPHIHMSLIKVANRCVSESARFSGGVGVTASVAAISEGVLCVMRIKNLAILGAALLSLGALVSFVGVSAFSAADQSGDKAVVRSDAKTESAPEKSAVQPEPATISKTYYVGDILAITLPLRSERVVVTGQQLNAMSHLINLITTTVARGTWRLLDQGSQVVKSESGQRGRASEGDGRTRPTGSITPFFLSISLIVNCTPEIHNQVATLLLGLRELLNARDNRTVDDVANRLTDRLKPPQLSPRDPKLVSPAKQPAASKTSDSMQHVQQLLDELNKEFKKLTPLENPPVGR
jgi:RNA polymerase sigma factor (sigma-70 family)